jgi:hypothetical protein
LQSFIGGGNGLGSRPRIKPKSTWKRLPSFLRRRLSKCLTKENCHFRLRENINLVNNVACQFHKIQNNMIESIRVFFNKSSGKKLDAM